MASSTPSASWGVRPGGCVICGAWVSEGGPSVVLCGEHQGMFGLAAWVDQGLVTDFEPSVGCAEVLNHRTLMCSGSLGEDPAARVYGGRWLDQVAEIVRRFGYWLGVSFD